MMEICSKIAFIPIRIFCITLLILQMAIIDVYLATYINKKWLAFIAGDIIVVLLFIIALVVSYFHIRDQRLRNLSVSAASVVQASKLPFSYIAWGVYAIIFVGKVLICFTFFAYKLHEKDFWGPNILKMMLALSAPIFLLFLLSHYSTSKESERKKFIDNLTSSVTFDIFDTVDILDILFTEQSRIILSFSMEKAILATGLVNLFLPLVPLMVLSRTQFGHQRLRDHIVDVYKILLMLVVNIPYIVIRLLLWNVYNRNISIFLMKNLMAIFVTIYDIYQRKQEVILDKVDAARNEEIAMT